MDSLGYIQSAEKDLLHTYNRYGVVLEKGRDVYLFDTNGKKYLDFAAGIAVCALGYGNEEYKAALKEQVDKLLHTSNLYYNAPVIEAARLLKRASGMDRVFFTNSGAEAVEGAIKAAKKYAYTRDGHGGHEIIAMQGSFHGRTIGALSVTGNGHYREPFEPLLPGIRFARFNDLDSVKEQASEKTCAVIMETVQGEGGIYPAEKEFIEGVAKLCRERDILFILDEIQCGMGRSGKMFAWQHYDVKPDIMAAAKALGCGVPVGAFVMTERVAQKSLVPGDHGTTYGGNPFAGAAVRTVLEIMERDKITEHVQEIGGYLWERLEGLRRKHECIVDHRGIGLMQGLSVSVPVGEVSRKALEKGLVLITAGADMIRFVPPLVIEEEHVDLMVQILDGILP
ncbi:MAG: aspartate aminotransferase family protein [Eubacterium sp.]|jgi:acetylornithine/N-succinyldiaminopimelate aminotransferase|nr:aspartate aminotransferase family protein [Eubacterium sp.]